MSVVECERPREPAKGELRSVTAGKGEQAEQAGDLRAERVKAVRLAEQKQGEKERSLSSQRA